MKPIDRRLLHHARAARGYLVFTVALGLVVTGLVLAQAGLYRQMRHQGANHPDG